MFQTQSGKLAEMKESIMHRKKIKHSILKSTQDLSDNPLLLASISKPLDGVINFSDESMSDGSAKETKLASHLDDLQQDYTTKKLPTWHPLADPSRSFDPVLRN
jgi:hypothetical protein